MDSDTSSYRKIYLSNPGILRLSMSTVFNKLGIICLFVSFDTVASNDIPKSDIPMLDVLIISTLEKASLERIKCRKFFLLINKNLKSIET